MDTFTKLKIMKLITDGMAHPGKFQEHFKIDIDAVGKEHITGKFTVTGPFFELVKEMMPNVQRTMEAKAKN